MTRRYDEAGEARIDGEVAATNQKGEVAVTGTFTAAVPAGGCGGMARVAVVTGAGRGIGRAIASTPGARRLGGRAWWTWTARRRPRVVEEFERPAAGPRRPRPT